jgi:hypothetical protein
MKSWFCAGCLFLQLSMVLQGAGNPVSVLQHAKSFALGGIGVAGTMSEDESALRVLLSEADATFQLESLLAKATPAGQRYAMLGLRLHDRAAYERARKNFPVPEVEVETIGGCIVSRAEFKDVLERIETGKYDRLLARPGS